MNELALFAGAGGGILGGKLIGLRTVCAVEINEYAASILVARQNDGILPPFPIWDDICTFDGRPWRGIVDVVSGGFPCQDISAAGKGAGIDGKQSGLWREMARVVCEVGPKFVLVENSPMLTIRGLGTVLGDLASMGYNAEWGVLGADDAGAPHIRKRIWILAYTRGERRREIFRSAYADEVEYARRCASQADELDCYGQGCRAGIVADTPQHGWQPRGPGDTEEEQERWKSHRGGIERNVSNPDAPGLQKRDRSTTEGRARTSIDECCWWDAEPDIC